MKTFVLFTNESHLKWIMLMVGYVLDSIITFHFTLSITNGMAAVLWCRVEIHLHIVQGNMKAVNYPYHVLQPFVLIITVSRELPEDRLDSGPNWCLPGEERANYLSHRLTL